MAKRGGFPGMGMPGNMNNLMKQAQKMQRQMEENQKALEEKEFTATVGGGAFEVPPIIMFSYVHPTFFFVMPGWQMQ